MCTAISLNNGGHCFGRNLDLERSYHETVTITPRNYPLRFRRARSLERHYALIGMAFVAGDYPLYYEATNERGLSMAGLNFPASASYYPEEPGKDNITPFELIPWVLGQCASVGDALPLLGRLNLLKEPFSESLPLSPLHWILSDKFRSLVIEAQADGMHLYENQAGVLTNEPPFPFHRQNLVWHMGLSPREEGNRFGLELTPYCRGLSGVGLPGDLSSPSRFLRAAFFRCNSPVLEGEKERVSQFFRLLDLVSMPLGAVDLGEGVHDYTIYSCCCDTDRGIYYYKTYHNSRVCAVSLWKEDLEGSALVSYELVKEQEILHQN